MAGDGAHLCAFLELGPLLATPTPCVRSVCGAGRSPAGSGASVHRRRSLAPLLPVGVRLGSGSKGSGLCFSTAFLSCLICIRGPFWMGDGTRLLCSPTVAQTGASGPSALPFPG